MSTKAEVVVLCMSMRSKVDVNESGHLCHANGANEGSLCTHQVFTIRTERKAGPAEVKEEILLAKEQGSLVTS